MNRHIITLCSLLLLLLSACQEDERYVSCEIEGVQFKIPKGYFTYGGPVAGCHPDSKEIFFSAFLPDILEEPRQRIANMDRKEREKYLVDIVITLPYNGVFKEEIFNKVSSEYKLEPISKGLLFRIDDDESDVYYGKTTHQHIISCRPINTTNPYCFGGVAPYGSSFNFNYTFPRSYLDNWKTTGLDIETLIKKIVINHKDL
jgi:hypothetical protein